MKNRLQDIDIVQADAFSFLKQDNEYVCSFILQLCTTLRSSYPPAETAEKLSLRGMIISIADRNTLTKSRRYAFLQFSLQLGNQKQV